MFGERAKSEGEKGEREEKEKSPPPQKIEGLGEEAFWVASHFGGMLYVRNPTGISHAPEEFASDVDCAAGVEALAKVLEELACR